MAPPSCHAHLCSAFLRALNGQGRMKSHEVFMGRCRQTLSGSAAAAGHHTGACSTSGLALSAQARMLGRAASALPTCASLCSSVASVQRSSTAASFASSPLLARTAAPVATAVALSSAGGERSYSSRGATALAESSEDGGEGGPSLGGQPVVLATVAAAPAPTGAPHTFSASGASGAPADEPPAAARAAKKGAVAILSPEEYRLKHSIHVEEGAPDPLQSFEEADLPPQFMSTIRKAGFPAPTTIQAQAWPIALQGRDLVAIASTGSGKTLGFLLPGLLAIKQAQAQGQARVNQGPLMLVLAPTRELARQIQEEAIKFGAGMGITNACLYGGAPRSQQHQELRRHPQIVVATPGRLLDFVESGALSLSQVQYLVLDEADRMLDMGFEPQMHKINSFVPRERQTLFFSATWPTSVQAAARQFCCNEPLHVFMGDVEAKLVANRNIRQVVRIVDQKDKLRVARDYLWSKPPNSRVIVFCGTKSRCDWLAYNLSTGANIRAAAIHGDKSQAVRDHVLAQFKLGRVPVLVATDVAARGLDISDVTAVLNFDFPNQAEMYIHRIGRTARGGATGESFTLFAEGDAPFARELVQILRDSDQLVPEELDVLAQQQRPGARRPQFGRPSGGRGPRGASGYSPRHRDGSGGSWSSDRSSGGYGGRGRGGDDDSWGDKPRRDSYRSNRDDSRSFGRDQDDEGGSWGSSRGRGGGRGSGGGGGGWSRGAASDDY